MSIKFRKVTIVGVGLIGGSIGLAVKKRRLAKEVVGLCRRESSCKRALAAGAVDSATIDPEAAYDGAELVVICAPVGKIAERAAEAARFCPRQAIITDAGSTKDNLVSNIEKMKYPSFRFVGSHPMAGSEKSGVENANPGLFEGSVSIVTKTRLTDAAALKKVKSFWTALGARCVELSPRAHDDVISRVSYLPHVVSYALSAITPQKALKYAATGFKDTTRISSSDPDLWADILLSARASVLRVTAEYMIILKRLEAAVKSNDRKSILTILDKAKSVRDKLAL